MNTFKNTQYTITTSLNERTVYVKIANNISYACYEGKFGVDDFQLPFKIGEIYALMNKCFAEMSGVEFELDRKILVCRFKILALGVLNLEFELKLREVVVTDDARMTVEFEQHRQIVDELRGNIAVLGEALDEEKRRREKLEKTFDEVIGRLSDAFIEETRQREELCNIISLIGPNVMLKFKRIHESDNNPEDCRPISSTLLKFNCQSHYKGGYCSSGFENIKYFYQLNELEIYGDCVWQCVTKDRKIIIKNNTVKKLSIGDASVWGNLEILKQFPNVEEWVCGGLNSNLEPTALENLKSIPHKLKRITLTGVRNANMLQSYCDKNSIELVLQ